MWFSDIAGISLAGFGSGNSFPKQLEKFKNEQEFIKWFTQLHEIALNRFKLNGLPDTCDERTIMRSLLWYGRVVFFEKDGAVLSLPGAPTTDINLYGYAGFAYVWGCNGFNEKVKIVLPNGDAAITNKGLSTQIDRNGEGFILYENKTRYPFIYTTMVTAERIADTMRTIDQQRQHFKRPYIITAQEETVNTVKKYFKQAKENQDLIIGTGVFDANSVNAIPISIADSEVKAMRELVEWYLAQYREQCGIDGQNPNTIDKKANLLVDEVESNNEQTEFDIKSTVDYINEQLKEVNKIFGLNITCEVNEQAEADNEDKEDEDNGVQDISRDSD